MFVNEVGLNAYADAMQSCAYCKDSHEYAPLGFILYTELIPQTDSHYSLPETEDFQHN
jgi:hypothetical protein